MEPGRTATDVVAELIALMRTESELKRRWPDHPAFRQWVADLAAQDRLYVQTGMWFHQAVLDPQGSVRVFVETDPVGEVEREANALESHIVWHRWVPRNYPSLAAWVPPRPRDAVVCSNCGGSGGHPYFGVQAEVVCLCGGAGWIPAEAVGLESFADLPSFDAAADAPKPAASLLERMRVRLRRWFARG